MKIKSVTLNNIGCFIGKNTFDLDTKDNLNIVYIEGENASGKTTIYYALRLGIYGTFFKNEHMLLYGKSKIKSLIKEKKESFIETLINIDNKDYYVKRNWVVIDDKIKEKCVIRYNDLILNAEESDLILNRIYKEMPYRLFECFYWDCNKVSKINNKDANFLKSIIETFFETNLDNSVETVELKNQISVEMNKLLKTWKFINYTTLNIGENFEIILNNKLGENVYSELSANDIVLINYIIIHSIIKISKKEGLFIFDEPFDLMDNKSSICMLKYIIPTMSDQVLLLNHSRHFKRLAGFMNEFNEHIYKKYYMDTINFG